MEEERTRHDSGAGAGANESSSRPPSVDATQASHPSTDGPYASGEVPSGRRIPDYEPLARGASVGRYVLLDQLGAGAMGVVYSAYDPELDRKLAVKLLHPRAGKREAKATRNRLRREAQALARLTHPNVVAVHDVGTHRGRVFVAMEFVAGLTLRQWLRVEQGEPRPIDAVIEVFSAAGQGLAAAHRAGLVHRDFKPENVLIGEDGTVRVVDFGLARRSEDELDGDSVDTSGTLSMDDYEYEYVANTATRSLDLSLTGTGRVMGTPAYMSPEQHMGEVATSRSDQFAFCVALWEAVYGERPFPGRDLPSLSLAVTTGDLRAPPSDGPFAHRVPSHLHRALVQGLSTAAEDRFARIEDLLTALTHDPSRRRRRIAKILAINLVGAAVVFGAGMWVAGIFDEASAADPVACAPEARLAGIWDATRKASLAQRFAESDAPFAAHSAREVERRLDAYTSQWIGAWGQTCETERTLGPSAELDLRRECLDSRRRELKAFTETLISTPAESFGSRAEHAVAAAESLPPISTCDDPSRLRKDPRASPEQRERVVDLQVRLSEARALGRLGEPTAGLTLAQAVVDDARALSSHRMLIRALLVVGGLEQRGNEDDAAAAHLREAYVEAERQGEDWLRAEAAVDLVGLLGFRLQRPAESAVWEQVASSLIERIGDPSDLRGRLHFEVGTSRMRQSDFEAAEDSLNRALGLYELVYGTESREVEPVLQRLGAVHRERGDHEAAVATHSRILARRRAAYGPDHPDVAAVYGSLGNDAYFRSDYATARAHYKEALRIVGLCYGEDSPAYAHKLSNYAAVLERLGELDEAEAIHRQLLAANEDRYGAQDVRVTTALENLGLVLLSAHELDEAAELFRRSLQIRVAHHGDEHTATATSKLNLGYALFQQGDYAQARALYAQTLATWTAKLDPDHPDLALVLGNIGDVDLAEGKYEAARGNYERALELTAATLGEDAADLGYYLTGLARVALAERKIDDAVRLSERALEVRKDTWLPPGDLGSTQLALSRALISRGRTEDRSRARDLALLAREDIRKSGDATELAAAVAWLAELGA